MTAAAPRNVVKANRSAWPQGKVWKSIRPKQVITDVGSVAFDLGQETALKIKSIQSLRAGR
jgi:hypothetical protein